MFNTQYDPKCVLALSQAFKIIDTLQMSIGEVMKRDIGLEDLSKEELIERLKHSQQLIVSLGNVLEDFSNLVLICCKQMERSGGVLGSVRNPFG